MKIAWQPMAIVALVAAASLNSTPVTKSVVDTARAENRRKGLLSALRAT